MTPLPAQIDTHLTLGTILTLVVFVFGVGGAWASLNAGLRGARGEIREVKKEVEELKQETARKDVMEERLRSLENLVNPRKGRR